MNIIFKISMKVTTNQSNGVVVHVVYSTRTSFIQGRNTLDGIVVLHETICELQKCRAESSSKLILRMPTMRVRWPSGSHQNGVDVLMISPFSNLVKKQKGFSPFPHT